MACLLSGSFEQWQVAISFSVIYLNKSVLYGTSIGRQEVPEFFEMKEEIV
jgi:hypothetical protein